MVMFNSFLYVYQRVTPPVYRWCQWWWNLQPLSEISRGFVDPRDLAFRGQRLEDGLEIWGDHQLNRFSTYNSLYYNIYIYILDIYIYIYICDIYIYIWYIWYIYIYIYKHMISSHISVLTYSYIPSHISRIDCSGIIISRWYQHIPFSFVLAVYHHWLYGLGSEVKMIGLAIWMVWSVLPEFPLLSPTEISDGGGHCKLNIHVNIGFVCYSKYPRCFVLLWGFLFFQWRYVKIKMIWLIPIDWYHMFRRVENPNQQIDTVIIYLAILLRGFFHTTTKMTVGLSDNR